MKDNLKWKFWLIAGISLLALVYILPSLTSSLPTWWSKKIEKIHLGLDLQGGMHLVLGVKLDKAIESNLERIATILKESMREKGIVYDKVERTEAGYVEMDLLSDDFVAPTEKILEDYINCDITHPVDGDNTRFKLVLKNAEIERIKESTLNQALETIRNRIDEFGVTEPTVQRHGTDEIVIELPGISDTRRAIDLIGKTAQLQFKVVDDESPMDEALKGNIPPDDEILYERTVDKTNGKVIKTPYLLKKKVLLTGDLLTDAEVKIGGEYGESYVAISFDRTGGKIFENITAENVGKRLAIILDNNVYSAPVIREKISGGHAQITGRFTTEEAHDLAIVLRAGALPAPVEILHQESVGPSLGNDSIRKGFMAMLLGFMAIVIFIIIYYKLSGFIANLALLLNILLIFASLAIFRATLTLPGIAGMVLSIGMSLDANILIFERIREELGFGKTVKAAVVAGYHKAIITILDSNLTTIIAAAILFQFGTGPVKGFAVTLCIGLIASLFTAVFVTRFVFDWFLSRKKITTLSI